MKESGESRNAYTFIDVVCAPYEMHVVTVFSTNRPSSILHNLKYVHMVKILKLKFISLYSLL